MAKNYIQEGKNIEYTATADIESGSIVVIGALIAIAISAIANTETGVVAVEGVWELPKSTGAMATGDSVYYDVSAQQIRKSGVPASGDIVNCGIVVEDAQSADTTVLVKINVSGGTIT